MLDSIKKDVCEANLFLRKYNLVILTWGNVSQRIDDLIVIKPSGVPYDKLSPDNMPVVDIDGRLIEGGCNPSCDTPTHLELYKAFPEIKGICHTHSVYATAFAQSGCGIECLGTTHADYFYGSIPCTRELTEREVLNDYEKNTGVVITEELRGKDVMQCPGVLVKHHGVFAFGKNAANAAENALVIEELAKMNYLTMQINNSNNTLPDYVLNKHYYRKHGGAYGQGVLNA